MESQGKRGHPTDQVALEQIASILESVNYPVMVLDRDCYIQYINQSGEELVGRNRHSIVGGKATLSLPEFFGKSFQHQQRSHNLTTASQYEEYFPPLDLWTEIHLCPSPAGILACVRDVTSRKRSERILTGQKRVLELVTSGASLSIILNAITAMIEDQSNSDLCTILLLSEDGRTLHLGSGGSVDDSYNDAVEGLEIGPAVGSCGTAAFTRRRVIAIDIAADPRWGDFSQVALNHGLRACWSQPILSRDGQRVLGTVANYSRRAGEPSKQSLMLLTTAAHLAQIAIEADRDVTERQRMQERLAAEAAAAEKANRAKDRFLAMLSHELRTPLAPALLLAMNMAANSDLPAEVREDAEMIQKSIELQTHLINDLLDLSRIENGKLVLHFQEVDLHELLLDSIRICGSDAACASINVSLSLRATRHTAKADPTRFRQVMCNLIKNAVKFTPAGGSITITSTDATDGTICILVSDTGIGAEPHMLAAMFDPFEQGGRERQSQGLGLGLTICKGLVEAHGGRISASSEGVGRGLTVTVNLPTYQAVESGRDQPVIDSVASQ